jgi:hypothetical protein
LAQNSAGRDNRQEQQYGSIPNCIQFSKPLHHRCFFLERLRAASAGSAQKLAGYFENQSPVNERKTNQTQ